MYSEYLQGQAQVVAQTGNEVLVLAVALDTGKSPIIFLLTKQVSCDSILCKLVLQAARDVKIVTFRQAQPNFNTDLFDSGHLVKLCRKVLKLVINLYFEV